MKRATAVADCVEHVNAYFNPRPREEGDLENPAGAIAGLDFNPRPREEGDIGGIVSSRRARISIHALVKRATDIFMGPELRITFQSTPS